MVYFDYLLECTIYHLKRKKRGETMAYSRQFKRITSFRLDHMISVKIEKEDLEQLRCRRNLNNIKILEQIL